MSLARFFMCEAMPGGAPDDFESEEPTKPDAIAPAAPAPKGQAGVRITGDAATLGALENILSDVSDESMQDWADEARDAIAAAIRRGGDQITATLPTFKATPIEDEGDME